MMSLSEREKVERILWTIKFLGLSFEQKFSRTGKEHLGAVLADAILQSGINYRGVVEPRVKRIALEYPKATKLRVIIEIIYQKEISQFLLWKGETKIRRFCDLVGFLYSHKLDSIEDVRRWVKCERNSESLLEIPGVGRKTVDYLRAKLGIPSIPIDRHLLRFACYCEVGFSDYKEASYVFSNVSQKLNVDLDTFDLSLWNFMVEIAGPANNRRAISFAIS